ncbi:hypothetical protein DFH06DRAFT_442154 [Mycena polygramma]|nr:hypothetical protein DFH06DRAFT_442154 [Mycena polygramma]
MSAQVPDELWLEVFSNLPSETLNDVSLTCSAFRRLTRTLIFAHFDFHPYALGAPAARSALRTLLVARALPYAFCDPGADSALPPPPDGAFSTHLARLNFYSSPEIAPLIRSCYITPIWQSTMPPLTFAKSTSPYVLLDIFFERMPRFTSLRRLVTQDIDFTTTAMTNLCRMPSLSSLFIEQRPGNGETHREEPAFVTQALALSNFSIRHDIAREDGISHWIPSLHPQHLRQLDLICNLSILGESLDAIPSFPRVHNLSMTMNLSKMLYNRAIMAKFPAVRVFTMHGWGSVKDGDRPAVCLDDVPFPALEEYIGTYKTLSTFLPQPTLTRVTILDAKPRGVIAQLQAACKPVNITAFTADFAYRIDTLTLGTILGLLPSVTELRIQIVVEPEDFEDFEDGLHRYLTTFFDALPDTPHLPPNLAHLALSLVSNDDYTLDDCVPLRDALRARCPALQTLWLGGHNFVYNWHRGTDVEVYVDDPELALVLQDQLDEFWADR